jgi:probable addiction module antidote protein
MTTKFVSIDAFTKREPDAPTTDADDYSPMDISSLLDSEETIAEYLTAAAEDDNPDVLLLALANVAKARGMSRVAEAAGLGRESLYKALAPGSHPRFETIVRLLRALGVKVAMRASNSLADIPSTQTEMTASEMSRLFDVSARTLRFYEDRGLLKPRREGNVRYYRASDRIRMEMILKGKNLGFTLVEIQDLIGASTRDLATNTARKPAAKRAPAKRA